MNTKKVLEQIARENNITLEKAELEMATAIRAAMVSSDPLAKEMWKKIAPSGKEPTVEEFLRYCAKKLR